MIGLAGFTIREDTKGAFCQARSKLNEWGFIRLNEVNVNTFGSSCKSCCKVCL